MSHFRFRGLRVHLIVPDVAQHPQLAEFRHVHRVVSDASHLLDFYCLGKIENLAKFSNLNTWAHDLHDVVSAWYDEFEKKNGNQWNNACNCQTFARFAAQRLGLSYPREVTIYSDIVPNFIFDSAIQLGASSKR